MPDPNTERFSTWISSDVMRSARVYAAYAGITQRQLIEDALRAYVESNPIDPSILDPAFFMTAKEVFDSDE